jgi:uncharacterized protein YqeY
VETLKERISKDYVSAFKSGEKIKKNLLGVVKSEITTIEKNINTENLSDAEVIKILNKISKNLKETLSQSDNEESKIELAIIESYLPTQMSEQEVRTTIEQIISETGAKSPGEIGKVMGGFNSKFAGKADNKLVSTIAKELLTKI